MRCCATRARFMSVMAVVVLVSFSPNGEYLAYSSPDGVLKLWETTTGKLAQEYTPSSHLSATCSCLQWGPNRRPRVSFTETFSLTVCHSQSHSQSHVAHSLTFLTEHHCHQSCQSSSMSSPPLTGNLTVFSIG